MPLAKAGGERKREQWETENYPEGEKLELVELYTKKGIPKSDAQKMVDIVSKHPKAWVDIMMVEELGIVEYGTVTGRRRRIGTSHRPACTRSAGRTG